MRMARRKRGMPDESVIPEGEDESGDLSLESPGEARVRPQPEAPKGRQGRRIHPRRKAPPLPEGSDPERGARNSKD